VAARALVRPLGYGLDVPSVINQPTRIAAMGTPPKTIEEFVGRVNTDTSSVSIARMTSPAGWQEPGQRPEFAEWSIVLRGVLVVEYEGGELEVKAGEAVQVEPGEWVRYRTPYEGGAAYVSVCVPAFSPDTVHRDAS
jgi:mannose-6-phosphate isomerase-like protein (cupin superfamily)